MSWVNINQSYALTTIYIKMWFKRVQKWSRDETPKVNKSKQVSTKLNKHHIMFVSLVLMGYYFYLFILFFPPIPSFVFLFVFCLYFFPYFLSFHHHHQHPQFKYPGLSDSVEILYTSNTPDPSVLL